MVIDTSAIIAILFGEPEARRFARAIDQDSLRLMSVVSVLEATMVVESELGEAGGRELDLLLHRAGIEVAGFLPEQLDVARHAFRTYGKGRHPAGLNFGDCFSYALAKFTGQPLLFKGNDFARTDIEACP
jgi:ribonuclease VapC